MEMVESGFETWWNELPPEMKAVSPDLLDMVKLVAHTAYTVGSVETLKVVDDVFIKPRV